MQLTLHNSSFQPINHFAEATADARGAVATRREVVDFILDLVGYTADQPLQTFRLLEPSFGKGAFLYPAVERLLQSYLPTVENDHLVVKDLSDAIRAVEAHRESSATVRKRLVSLLRKNGVSEEHAHRLLANWIVEGDFLLVELPDNFSHIVGNPPYVRHELIPRALMTVYRARYTTIFDRADLYIPFMERSLLSLKPEGVLGFICSDRWMKNRYGGPLRALVSRNYHLSYYVDMVGTQAFDSEVIAYPAITVIKREKPGPTRIAHRPATDRESLSKLAADLQAEKVTKRSGVVEAQGVANGHEPWILQSLDQLDLIRRLEAEFPTLEQVGCKVGIGVATGADKVFIAPFEKLDVETDRKLPLVQTADIRDGTVKWHGLGVLNPFQDDGSLVDLADYPKLARYLEEYADVIRQRHCARTNPKAWYRTIDRIYPHLTYEPKLLIPDIKGEAHVVYEDGSFYPHHNLYFITSDEWHLKALQAVLRSGIAKLFVSVYSTQMRGGYLRFQAQYLRRIRIPRWTDVPEFVRNTLIDSADLSDVESRNQAVSALYGLTPAERAILNHDREDNQ